MPESQQINLADYIGMEESNLFVSSIKFQQEIVILSYLENLFNAPLEVEPQVSEDNAVILQLYIYVHYHLYFSVTTLLRCHLSEAFASLRCAIEASLIAYRLIEGHGTSKQYVNREKTFQRSKGYIEKQRKKDPKLFTLAPPLLGLYDQCSSFASHADFETFMHRLEILKEEKSKIKVSYFQFPKDDSEFRFFVISVIYAYGLMLKIFEKFIVAHLGPLPEQWGKDLTAVLGKLKKMGPSARET